MYAVLDSNVTCPSCNDKIEEEGVHHCMIWVNGLPSPGTNHMKRIYEIKEVIRGLHVFPPTSMFKTKI